MCVELPRFASTKHARRGPPGPHGGFPWVLANAQVSLRRSATTVCPCLSPTVESVMDHVSHCPCGDKCNTPPRSHTLSSCGLTPRYKVPVPRGAVESRGLAWLWVFFH